MNSVITFVLICVLWLRILSPTQSFGPLRLAVCHFSGVQKRTVVAFLSLLVSMWVHCNRPAKRGLFIAVLDRFDRQGKNDGAIEEP